ncbi:MAG: PAS domain S-box protein [Bacteroidota bacterium]
MNLKALFVDDDAFDQMALATMAEKSQLIQDFYVASSIREAKNELAKNDYNIIVTDYDLTDGSGIEIVRTYNDKPVIVLTGRGDEHISVNVMRAGAVDYLVKDIDSLHIKHLPSVMERAYKEYVTREASQIEGRTYKYLFENALDLIQILDPKTLNLAYVNPSWCESLGYSKIESKQIQFTDIIHPDNQKEATRLLTGLRRGETFRQVELRFITKKGESIYVEGNLNNELDESGLPISVTCVFRDVTEKRIMDLKLRESEKRYRMLVESANDAIFNIDVNGKLQFINQNGCEMFGLREKELVGIQMTNLISLLHENDQEGVIEFYRNQFNQKIKRTYRELPIIRKDGSKIWVGLNLSTLFDEQNPQIITGYLGVLRDISKKILEEKQLKSYNQILEEEVALRVKELKKTNSRLIDEIELRKKTAEALKISEKEYRHLFQNANDAIIILDAKTKKVVEANQIACQIYGFPKEQLLKLGYREILGIPSHETFNKNDIIEYNFIAGKQEVTSLEIRVTKVIYQGKKAILCISRNVTERKRVDRLLRLERNRSLTALIDGQEMERKRLSQELHDGLGQLLTAISIYLKRIDQVVKDKKAIGLVARTKEILKETIKEVRSISHNLMPSVLSDFGLEIAIRNMLELIRPNYPGVIRYYVYGNIDRMEPEVEIGLYRIAQEAINNALKYAKSSKITVKLKLKNNRLELVIKDNGKGFSTKDPRYNAGNGIANMEQRAKLIGFKLDLHSSSAKGTEISVHQDS